MKLTCPQCGYNNDTPAQACKNCGVTFTVIPKENNDSFIAYLFILILGIIALARFVGTI
jgi:uncharacterized protein (DUF983 family)